MSTPDTIERQIRIEAPRERVWALVSEPGWWINEGTIRPHHIEQREGFVVVTDEKWGDFRIEVVESEPQSRVAFRWLVSDQEGGDHADVSAPEMIPTLVEFTLTAEGDSTLVRVVESGFAAAPVTAEARQRAYHDNAEGWETELAAAKSHVETGA
ncbi:SRPBCC domain-containing protein [Luteipulveratus halotolerans]|nr:SRPBCC domain-containing protein [Luteipulveratus halotolerans]